MAGALLLGLAALSGCAELPRGPLAAPSPPMFLAAPEPRALGPLQPVSESEVHVVEKDVPTGTIALEKMSFDMDSTVRASNERRSIEGRITQHQDRIVRVQNLGVTRQGLLRFRFNYLHDGTISLTDEKRSSKTSPVLGKTYVMEVGRRGVRVFTEEGFIPPPDELNVVLKDGKHLLSLVVKRGTSTPPLTSEFVTRSTREQLVRAGLEVRDLKASFKGVREIDGTPCAVFDLSIDAAMQKTEEGMRVAINLKLSGEYALRVADGWEAEIFLTGSALSSGTLYKNGVEVQVSSAGVTRVHILTTYQEPDLPSPAAVAVR